MLESLDELGTFWIPGREDDKLSGRLIFNPKESEISLLLVGSFSDADSMGMRDVERIFGWVGKKKVTVDRCFTSSSKVSSPGVNSTSIIGNRIFLGAHIEVDDSSFKAVTLSFSDLGNWASKSGIVYKMDSGRASDVQDEVFSASYVVPEKELSWFDRGKIILSYRRHCPLRRREIHLEEWPTITIEYATDQPLSSIWQDVGAVHDLLILCMDGHVAVDRCILESTSLRKQDLAGGNLGPQAIELLDLPIRYTPPQERKPRYYHDMLLSFEELGGIDGVARWIDSHRRFRRSLESFMSVRHADKIFAENRFLNVTYAAEAFHRAVYGGKEMEEGSYNAQMDRWLEVTPEEHHEWLINRLRYANEPSLNKRLQGLAQSCGSSVRGLIGERGKWAYTLAQVRNHLTHLSEESHRFSGEELNWLSESVYSVVRVCMLLESGVDSSVLDRKSGSHRMIWYKDHLRQSIKSVRAKLRLGASGSITT